MISLALATCCLVQPDARREPRLAEQSPLCLFLWEENETTWMYSIGTDPEESRPQRVQFDWWLNMSIVPAVELNLKRAMPIRDLIQRAKERSEIIIKPLECFPGEYPGDGN